MPSLRIVENAGKMRAPPSTPDVELLFFIISNIFLRLRRSVSSGYNLLFFCDTTTEYFFFFSLST
jgi:hypothetical protein